MENIQLLRTGLRINAAFSSFCALAFLAASSPLAKFAGTTPADILSTGVSLVVFVAFLLALASRPGLDRGWPFAGAVVVAVMDVLWVVGTPQKVAAYSSGGQALFWGISIVVGAVALVQIVALTRIRTARRASLKSA